MRTYLIKRIILMIPIFIGITIIIFTLINMTPGDPYASMVESGLTKADREAMLEKIGYYDSIPTKYFRWLGRAVQGDLGYSIRYKAPVTQVIGNRIGNTVLLSLSALVLSTLIAIPLGIISANRQYSVFDYVATIIAFIGISIPAFFFALGLIKLLAVDLKWFPISGISSLGKRYTGWRHIVDVLHHLFLPVIVLSFMQTASLMRYTRSSMLEVLNQDYIRTARSKGLSNRKVVYSHALKNGMIPIATMLGLSLGGLFSGAVLTETVFNWPGMGTLMYQAVGNRDYPLITAIALITSIAVLLSNLISDVVYALIDPRIRFDEH